jgi:hypothetical protein
MGMELGIFSTLKSWRFWVLAAIPEVLFLFIWWLGAKLIGTSPFVRDIFAGIIFVAVIFALAWALPKYALQYASGKTESNSIRVSKKPSRLEHDNVLWEDGGKSGWGISVIGPLCPKDFAVLSIERYGKIEKIGDYSRTISKDEYDARLYCPECKRKYTLGKEAKKICDSEDEVRNRFEGKRRREQET